QASVVEKGVTMRTFRALRIDVIVGSIFAPIVAGFIVVACAAALHSAGYTQIHDAADAAQALRPVAGRYAFVLFAAGLFNASLFASCIIPLSTSYTVCEGLGFESGLDKKFGEAPFFYWLYTTLIVAAAGVVLIPEFPLLRVAVLSQVINGVLLPFILFFMLRLVNNRELMGEYVNSRLYNAIAWITTVAMLVLTVAMLWTM
ncbi:MAG: NRAMP family divalent metal transporter, partial [Terriglobales bacterium]